MEDFGHSGNDSDNGRYRSEPMSPPPWSPSEEHKPDFSPSQYIDSPVSTPLCEKGSRSSLLGGRSRISLTVLSRSPSPDSAILRPAKDRASLSSLLGGRRKIVKRYVDDSDESGDDRKHSGVEQMAISSNRSSFSIDNEFGTDDGKRFSFSLNDGDYNSDDNAVDDSDDSFSVRRRQTAVQERSTRDVLLKSKGNAQAIAEEALALVVAGGMNQPQFRAKISSNLPIAKHLLDRENPLRSQTLLDFQEQETSCRLKGLPLTIKPPKKPSGKRKAEQPE
jgi:hypothetical protein